MLRRNKLSKSTKCRRLLDETNFIEHVIDNVDSSSNYSVELENNGDSFELENNESIDESDYNNVDETESNIRVVQNRKLNVENLVDDSEEFEHNDANSCTTEQSFSNNLIQCATEHNVPNNTFDDLLKILKSHKCFNEFPVTSRTFYKTHSGVTYDKLVNVESVPPGIYYHFGVKCNIIKYLDKNFSDEVIKLVIGVDGLPLAKSSGSMFWPILAYIRQKNEFVFPIGIYWGYNKPEDSNMFVKYFVDEIKEIITYGIDVEVISNNSLTFVIHKSVIVDTFCCDAPARAFLLKTKSHTGFFSCGRCTVKGKYVSRRVCFPDLQFSKRTHEDFVRKLQRQYHIVDSTTEIINIPHFDIVQDFSLDYMHLVCLGVVRKILMLWKGSIGMGRGVINKQKLNSLAIKKISVRLITFKNSIPCDFARKCRSLDDLARWKATEFRLFLLYVGVVAIHSIVTKKIYQHFLSLNIAMTIFLSPNFSNLANVAKILMVQFVKDFGILYGEHFISYNVHGLIHLFDDFNKFGPLDTISCFKFENYVYQLKKMVRKSDKPLQQVVKRYEERCNILNPPTISQYDENKIMQKYDMAHHEGPLINGTSSPQFKILTLDKVKIKVHSNSDSYVGLNVNSKLTIIKVVNICYSQIQKRNILLGRQFEKIERFFEKPIRSDQIGIYKLNNFSKTICSYHIEDVKTKYMVLTAEDLDFVVAFPIIHFNN